MTRTTSTAVDDRPLPEPPPRVVEKTGAPETPTDAQIAELAAAIDHAELDQARLAALRAMSPKVKRFAEHVVTTRTAGIQKMDATLRGERFAPTESQRSLDLKTEARMTLGTLEDETGSQFDRAFLEAQIRGQESAADLIDRTLLPNAENERLKDDLRRQRARVGEDIESAKAVLTSLITSQP